VARSGSAEVDHYIAALGEKEAAIVSRLRRLALAAGPGITEHIKWNAPSFCKDGEDRITLGLDRKGGVRVVLHRGAKAKDAAGFRFDDPHGLARWAAPDRGVLAFADVQDVIAQSAAVQDLFSRWILATRA
jgi:hypothetical protein